MHEGMVPSEAKQERHLTNICELEIDALDSVGGAGGKAVLGVLPGCTQTEVTTHLPQGTLVVGSASCNGGLTLPYIVWIPA